MQLHSKRIFILLMIAIIAIHPVHGDSGEKMTISITTDSFELTETDGGSLAVGEAKTIQTESGHVVDILRTPEGAEVYIDGELVDIGSDHERLSEELHVISSDIAVSFERAARYSADPGAGDDPVAFERGSLVFDLVLHDDPRQLPLFAVGGDR